MGESYNRQREGTPSIEPALRVAVTGGTAGLGLALVREFRRRGAAIAFVARGQERVGCVVLLALASQTPFTPNPP